MADRYSSLITLVLAEPADVTGVMAAATANRDVDRHAPIGDGLDAHEVAWGGRMQKAVVRRILDEGPPKLRVETYIGGDGLRHGMQRHAQLLQGLARVLEGSVLGVRDLSAQIDRDLPWLHRVAAGDVAQDDAVVAHDEGEGTIWVHTHGAARLDIPDLEIYGVIRAQVPRAIETLAHLHAQLLKTRDLRSDLTLPDGTPCYLVPVLEAWNDLPLDWPGIGRAGKDRPGHDGPRATLSVLHKPRFGRFRRDFKGVLGTLARV